MKVLFVPVTYNSYDALDNYIASVGKALEAAADPTISVKIHVADNSNYSRNVECGMWNENTPSAETTHYDNPGYLPAALKTVYSEDYASYDYIILSNVDVTLDETFFIALRDLKPDPDTVWIAPFIWSPSENRDVNPKILERYTKKRLQLLRLLFACPPLYYLYTRTLYRKKVNKSRSEENVRYENTPSAAISAQSSTSDGNYNSCVPSVASEQSSSAQFSILNSQLKNIYSGHGSFMIFRPELFQQEPPLDYPVFLFCEEIFMAEMVRRIGKKTVHCPTVKVWDCEHASTGLIGLWRYCKYNHDALSYIIKNFYEQD